MSDGSVLTRETIERWDETLAAGDWPEEWDDGAWGPRFEYVRPPLDRAETREMVREALDEQLGEGWDEDDEEDPRTEDEGTIVSDDPWYCLADGSVLSREEVTRLGNELVDGDLPAGWREGRPTITGPSGAEAKVKSIIYVTMSVASRAVASGWAEDEGVSLDECVRGMIRKGPR